jgi:hypothetical protein
MCKGVSWFQPFVQLLPAGRASSGGAVAAAAAVVAAAEGRDQSRPQGCFTVLVQPHLPLLKVGFMLSGLRFEQGFMPSDLDRVSEAGMLH